MERAIWLARLLKTHTSAVSIFARIHQQTGYASKEVTAVDLPDYKLAPVWYDGRIEIGYSNDPESIAHEMGTSLRRAFTKAPRHRTTLDAAIDTRVAAAL